MPNRPGQPFRRSSRERAAGITSHLCPSQGACGLQATGGLASRIAAAPPSPGHPCVLGRRARHRSSPDWRASKEHEEEDAEQGVEL